MISRLSSCWATRCDSADVGMCRITMPCPAYPGFVGDVFRNSERLDGGSGMLNWRGIEWADNPEDRYERRESLSFHRQEIK